ncbi:forkhead-associated domain-containing 1-like, partial [Brachionus plicatilis]
HDIKQKLSISESELKEKEENFKTKIDELTLKFVQTEENYNKELAGYREQIKQYSLTIVNFEKEVKRLHEKEVEYLTKIENLDKKLKDSLFNKKPPTPKPSSPVNTSSSLTIEITSLNRQLDLIKNENQVYKVRLAEQDELIKTLRRDLTGASAKLSDIHGEMTDKQKRELERNKLLVVEQQRELSDNRAQMAKLSEIVDKQTRQLDALRVELNKSKSLVEKYKHMSDENGTLAVELKSKLDNVESQLAQFEDIKKHEGKITNELTAVGAQCKGERHEQVIQRQREALNELRQRVKILEQSRPAIPNSEVQMQQQIMLLKKQLAEVRASQALTEDIVKQANMARGNDPSFLVLEEKTAHFETQTALDVSEESYLTLLRTISAILDFTELDGLRSMANLSPDERQKLLSERTKSTEAICVRIKVILIFGKQNFAKI